MAFSQYDRVNSRFLKGHLTSCACDQSVLAAQERLRNIFPGFAAVWFCTGLVGGSSENSDPNQDPDRFHVRCGEGMLPARNAEAYGEGF